MSMISDADGCEHEYRLVTSRLERRTIFSSIWQEVCGGHFLRMTPAELRHVADVLERKEAP